MTIGTLLTLSFEVSRISSACVFAMPTLARFRSFLNVAHFGIDCRLISEFPQCSFGATYMIPSLSNLTDDQSTKIFDYWHVSIPQQGNVL
jgi:hypothetical protein